MKINFLQQRILIVTKDAEVAQSLLKDFIQDLPLDRIVSYKHSKSGDRLILKGNVCIEAIGEPSIRFKRAKYNRIYCDTNISQEIQNNILRPLVINQSSFINITFGKVII